jgi:hypothetical protein
MNELNPIEIWKHKKLLTLEQATFLIIGKDPSEYADASAGGWYGVEKPAGFDVIYSIIEDAITYLDLNANVYILNSLDADEYYISDSPHAYGSYSSLIESSSQILDKDMVDWRKTTIPMTDFKKWSAKEHLNGNIAFLFNGLEALDEIRESTIEAFQTLKADRDAIKIENEKLKFDNREKSEVIANMEMQMKSMDAYIGTMTSNQLTEKEPINQNKSDVLTAVNQASMRFWSRADRNDQDTWTTNQVVINWLMKEHKFSEHIAKAAATIVRPEWAKK